MKIFKRMTLAAVTGIFFMTGITETHAQSNEEALQSTENKIKEAEKAVQQKEKEKQSINSDVQNIQSQLNSLHTVISNNKKELASTEKQISEANKMIEKKKKEIVVLQEKVLSRKDIIENRLVALQQDDKTSVVIDTLMNADNFGDFVARMGAVTTLLSADNDILKQHQNDLNQIEKDKKEIDKQEKVLEAAKGSLAAKQAELDKNVAKQTATLTTMQEKYSKVVNEIDAASSEKANLQSELTGIQDKIAKEKEAAQKQAEQVAKQQAAEKAEADAEAKRQAELATAKKEVKAEPKQEVKTATEKKAAVSSEAKETKEEESTQKHSGKEMYVEATAYTANCAGCSGVTATGQNVSSGTHKIIAVDPSVIPLGSKVYVEGYGVATAGDTGGAIKGYRIDVLVPSESAAKAFGRRTVKITVLN
jgi:3D (Asp-Asp-Asp) domain-containing protein/peptidoglycan hydrolase CwlO-like protein